MDTNNTTLRDLITNLNNALQERFEKTNTCPSVTNYADIIVQLRNTIERFVKEQLTALGIQLECNIDIIDNTSAIVAIKFKPTAERDAEQFATLHLGHPLYTVNIGKLRKSRTKRGHNMVFTGMEPLVAGNQPDALDIPLADFVKNVDADLLSIFQPLCEAVTVIDGVLNSKSADEQAAVMEACKCFESFLLVGNRHSTSDTLEMVFKVAKFIDGMTFEQANEFMEAMRAVKRQTTTWDKDGNWVDPASFICDAQWRKDIIGLLD